MVLTERVQYTVQDKEVVSAMRHSRLGRLNLKVRREDSREITGFVTNADGVEVKIAIDPGKLARAMSNGAPPLMASLLVLTGEADQLTPESFTRAVN
jgi:hypothetical protein